MANKIQCADVHFTGGDDLLAYRDVQVHREGDFVSFTYTNADGESEIDMYPSHRIRKINIYLEDADL